MHLLHISHRVEDNMILTTTYAENYGREEIHKTLVQMADVAGPANESDVLWRHTTFEEAVSYLVAIAVVLETDSKELFAIVSVYIRKASSVSLPHTLTFLFVWGNDVFGTLCILPVFTPLFLSCLQDYRDSTAASPALLLQARKVSCF